MTKTLLAHGAHTIRAAVQATLETWLPSTLSEVADAAGITPADVPHPRTWTRLPEFRAARPDQLPAVVVTSPGLAGTPRQTGEGTYDADWEITAFCVVRAETYEGVADLVGLYTAAIRSVLITHPTLDGSVPADGTDWTGESYAELDSTQSRTIGAGFVTIEVSLTGVQDVYALRDAPPEDPYELAADDPTVATVDVDVNKEPL